jgi:hypothetical protein
MKKIPKYKLEEIKRLVREGKVTLESQDKITEYEKEIKQVIDALGLKKAPLLITDGSSISDFCGFNLSEEEKRDRVAEISNKLGIKVYWTDMLTDVAGRLRSLGKK